MLCVPRSSRRCESVQGFLLLHCRKQRFYPTLLILWWCEGIKSLQGLNCDLLLSIPRDSVCISFYWFPWQFGVYLLIHFHFKPHKKRCFQLLCIQWQIPCYQTHSDSCLKNDALDSTQGFKSHPLQGVLVQINAQFPAILGPDCQRLAEVKSFPSRFWV